VLVTSHPDFVSSRLRNVAHPRKSLITGLFNDLKVAHLNPGNSKVRNLKMNSDGRLVSRISKADCGQAKVGAQDKFFSTGKLLDSPENSVFFLAHTSRLRCWS